MSRILGAVQPIKRWLGVSRILVAIQNSLELDPDSSQGELAIILIRIAISLDALTGGEAKWMQHFMKSPNKLTKGIPIKQIQITQGLATVLNVVEELRLQGKY